MYFQNLLNFLNFPIIIRHLILVFNFQLILNPEIIYHLIIAIKSDFIYPLIFVFDYFRNYLILQGVLPPLLIK